MADKTHWKKIVSDPNYLGEADFNEGEEKIAITIGFHRGVQTSVGTSNGKVEISMECSPFTHC